MKIQFFIQCLSIIGLGFFHILISIYSMTSMDTKIITGIIGSVIIIVGFSLYVHQYLKELKLGPVRFE